MSSTDAGDILIDEITGHDRRRHWPPAGQLRSSNVPFFIILNVAVGGNWPGSPKMPRRSSLKQMLVDYVRVYTQQ